MSKLTDRISSTINDMGNALTAAGWPGPTEHSRDTKEIWQEFLKEYSDVVYKDALLQDCAHELCMMCADGKITEDCDGCRWKKVENDGGP